MSRSRQQGLTYLFVLLALAAMGVWLAAVGTLWSTAARREKERALLDAGHAYREAIGRYYQQTPGSVRRYPENLPQLLLDRRYLQVRRHLRRPYPDPVTGEAEWGLVLSPDGGVMGVYSKSGKEPLKKAGFAAVDEAFTGASRYSEWKFTYVPPVEASPQHGP